ncbi:MAG: hypothetical protein WC100_01460 [Sterolibacterium sp.]
MTDTQTERVARALCKAMGVDPDAEGYAITPATQERLSARYKLWQYQIPAAEAAIEAAL